MIVGRTLKLSFQVEHGKVQKQEAGSLALTVAPPIQNSRDRKEAGQLRGMFCSHGFSENFGDFDRGLQLQLCVWANAQQTGWLADPICCSVVPSPLTPAYHEVCVLRAPTCDDKDFIILNRAEREKAEEKEERKGLLCCAVTLHRTWDHQEKSQSSVPRTARPQKASLNLSDVNGAQMFKCQCGPRVLFTSCEEHSIGSFLLYTLLFFGTFLYPFHCVLVTPY
ncbi:hypothetical protein AAFF_G00241470 [Aldrovandia affinis]|uniref:Uncharacterized protein n=1 Tax=Aldrovandia affinis TaxID=143900 RepID=A0AAD7SUU0_9TELE|nr:hypothetical protein AAFF_G00241470 [Aldrovandia affinis]